MLQRARTARGPARPDDGRVERQIQGAQNFMIMIILLFLKMKFFSQRFAFALLTAALDYDNELLERSRPSPLIKQLNSVRFIFRALASNSIDR